VRFEIFKALLMNMTVFWDMLISNFLLTFQEDLTASIWSVVKE